MNRNNLSLNEKEPSGNLQQKGWLDKLVADLEKLISDDIYLPFRVTELKEKGFLAKVNGLFAFISYNHMPWRYPDHQSWSYVFEHIKNYLFFCQVYSLEKDPLSVTLNGKIQQFRPARFVKDESYKGIVIKKTDYGVFVEFGICFHWQCGSVVHLIHKLNFKDNEFHNIRCGDLYEAIFTGESGEDFNYAAEAAYEAGHPETLLGKTVTVEIKKHFSNQFSCLVEGKYKGSLPASAYPPERKTYMRQALGNLKDGEIIHCEVVHISPDLQLLQLKWSFENEIEEVFERNTAGIESKNKKYNIEGRLNKEVTDKLNLIGQLVDVEVVKKTDPKGNKHNRYMVNHKYKGELFIANHNHPVSMKEKTLIEKNLQDNEKLKCTVLSIEKNNVKLKWEISDDDYLRFLKT